METGHVAGPAPAEAGVAGPRDPDRALFLIEDTTPAAVAGDGSPRRRLADRVALDLVEPPPDGVRNEASMVSLAVAVARVAGLSDVFGEAAAVVAAGGPDAVRVARGRGGVVVRLHAPAWSVVFRIGGPVFVVMDARPAHALLVSADPDWRPEVAAMVEAVLVECDRRVSDVPGRAPLAGDPAPPLVQRR